jgi:hypothetical protein
MVAARKLHGSYRRATPSHPRSQVGVIGIRCFDLEPRNLGKEYNYRMTAILPGPKMCKNLDPYLMRTLAKLKHLGVVGMKVTPAARPTATAPSPAPAPVPATAAARAHAEEAAVIAAVSARLAASVQTHDQEVEAAREVQSRVESTLPSGTLQSKALQQLSQQLSRLQANQRSAVQARLQWEADVETHAAAAAAAGAAGTAAAAAALPLGGQPPAQPPIGTPEVHSPVEETHHPFLTGLLADTPARNKAAKFPGVGAWCGCGFCMNQGVQYERTAADELAEGAAAGVVGRRTIYYAGYSKAVPQTLK